MSKSKKNVVDPENMIKSYGADAVRLLYSFRQPSEKDIQWSERGVVSANKFLQKIWNLNLLILSRKEKKIFQIRTHKKNSLKYFTIISLNYLIKLKIFNLMLLLQVFIEIYNNLFSSIDKRLRTLF